MFNANPMFSSFTQPQQFYAAWQKNLDDQLRLLGGLDERYSAAEAQGYARAGSAVDAWADLMKASLGYAEELSKQLRAQTLEAAKHAGKMASGT